MKISVTRTLTFLTSTLLVSVESSNPLNVQINFRGQIHEIGNVSTLTELQSEIENTTQLEKSKQGILFQGKNLLSSTIGDADLEELGLVEGSVLNVVPKKSKKSSKKSSAAKLVSDDKTSNESKSQSPLDSQMAKMEEMLKAQGIDPEELKKMMPEDGKMPDPSEAMNMMKDMMSSPMFDSYMNDEDRLEESRQAILNNPMMKNAMKSVPGFDEILNSKEMWRDTMRAAAQMYKNMDPDQLSAMMNMGMGGAGGMPGAGGFPNMDMGGLFGSSSPSNAALDELSEGDD